MSGAGIAGLACALFISRAGFAVELFERETTLDPIGSGIQLSPNAMHVLAMLGLERQIKTAATAPPAIDIFNAMSGSRISAITLGNDIVKTYGQPYLAIHRADLQKILLSACRDDPDISLRMGVKVRDAVAHPNGVTLVADSAGGTVNSRGVGLIGADGVHSVIRAECFPPIDATPAKTAAFRALIRADDIPEKLRTDNIRMWLASGLHAVSYPVRGAMYHNIVISASQNYFNTAKDNNRDRQKFSAEVISSRLSGWNDDIKQLLAIKTDWTRWPLVSAPNLKTWQEGAILLVGDAAHAMGPHAAQGAAMALEDAAVLGWALRKNVDNDNTGKDSPDIKSAFENFYLQRFKRVEAVRRLSVRNHMLFQLPAGLAALRNLGMRAMGGRKILHRQDWIYNWRLPA